MDTLEGLVNIIVVSNRVARTTPDEPIAGGLAAALLPAVKSYGAIWVGASGKLQDRPQQDAFAKVEAFGKGALATIDLPRAHYRGFYEGFSNSALWPTLHSRTDLIRANEDDYHSYCEINAYVARGLIRFSSPNTSFWVQDYHYLTLGRELRELGIEQPLGFFLHTPWPARGTIVGLPHHRELVDAMLHYSLIGFQTEADRQHFAEYVRDELGLHVFNDEIHTGAGLCRIATFPIGIDVDAFAQRATKAAASPEINRLRASLNGAKLAIGVDRIDYSKGLPNRMRAFDRLLTTQPSMRGQVSFLQIAVPSRGGIDAYHNLQSELSTLVGEINGRHGEADWTPIRYINKGFSHRILAGFYRSAQIGVVTPFHDGMNLVAKEYIAAQNPFDPGVLVLSRYTGAAEELDSALIVNPHDVDDVARNLATAMTMSCAERIERWDAAMVTLRKGTVHKWFSNFVRELEKSADPLSVPRSPALLKLEPAKIS
jgi:trehalose 6-phosphate synthase